ncbi:MAG TPA: D-2-hydroxyacid dehydrogenase [Pirellulales bacterium]|nr:D-2-hydroxyacid dehydrogenase [Pirellulales bacterium]
MRIVLCYPVEQRHIAQIAAAVPEADVVNASQQSVAEDILEADIFCGHAKERPIPWDDVVRRGRLKWIQSSAAGMDHCLVPSVIDSDIVVTSASGVLADQVAEQTMALMSGLARGLPVFFRAQLKKEFIRRPTRDLHHATVGLVGFGGNGRRLADVLRAFKMRILATDYFPQDRPEYVESLWPPERLDEMLPETDYLILAAPLNEHTRGMINARTLALMKPGAMLINVARGKLVVEDDLVAALKGGHLAGAGLDVTAEEPLPATSPLWELPNVIITPHVGGQSARRIDDMTDFFCENLHQWHAGLPLLNSIEDKHLGFPRPNMLPAH